MAASGRRQHSDGRTRTGFARFKRHRGAARQGKVAFSVMQAATGDMHRSQAGRARGIHRHRRTVQSHRVGNPPGAHGEAIAHVSVRPLQCVGLSVHELVVVMHQSHEHAGLRFGQRVPSQTTVLHGLPGGFQQQAVLRIHRGRFFFGDAEKLGIKAGDVIQECAPLTHRPTRRTSLGIVVLVDVPSVGWNFGDQVVAAQQRLP